MYHYTECGLDNVWLKNGYEVHDTPYGKGVAIRDAQGLHALLAKKLVMKPGRLTGKEVRFLRVQMGLSQEGLGRVQGVSEQAVSLWERHGKVPKANDMLTRICYMAHCEGKTPLHDAMERIKIVEELVHQKIVASTGKAGWSSKIENVERQETAEAA